MTFSSFSSCVDVIWIAFCLFITNNHSSTMPILLVHWSSSCGLTTTHLIDLTTLCQHITYKFTYFPYRQYTILVTYLSHPHKAGTNLCIDVLSDHSSECHSLPYLLAVLHPYLTDVMQHKGDIKDISTSYMMVLHIHLSYQ